MKKSDFTLIKKRDIFLILAMILIAAVVFFAFYSDGESTSAVVRVGKKVEKTLDLNVDFEYIVESNGHTMTVVVENGAVGIKNADCPDKVCEQTGFIKKAGSTIVCVPALVTVTVESKTAEVPYDAKTR